MIDVAECKASLWLIGDTLDPDNLALSLGCIPTNCIRKGDIYLSGTGEELVASTGRFQLTTGWRSGEPLERLICELLEQVPEDPALWAEINSTLSGEVFCGLILASVNEEAKISAGTLAAIALANKNARIAWAMMTSGDRYREPMAIAA